MANLRLVFIVGVLCILGTVNAKPASTESPLGTTLVTTPLDNQNELIGDIAPKIVNKPEVAKIEPNITSPITPGSKDPAGPPVVPKIPEHHNFFDRRQEQINNGVNTIVNGSMEMVHSIEKILRGSFAIPYSSHVRTTANNILDAIFGNFRN